MKKLIFKHSDPEIKTVKDSEGADVPMAKALKLTLALGVNQAPPSIETFRLWVPIGNKLDSDDVEVKLEDAQLDLVKNLFAQGLPKAFETMANMGLPSEVDRILNEAEDIKDA